MTDILEWTWFDWATLDPDHLYACLRLRSDVFVVEQACAYPDIDGLDPRCRHLFGSDSDGALLAYLRLVPPGTKFPGPALGRLVVAAEARRRGLARAAMHRGLGTSHQLFPKMPVYLSGQEHLCGLYASLGFKPISEPYLEDGIPHVDMRRESGN